MYFHKVDSVEALKREYKRLAMQYHPDRGGDTATMQEINAEYERLFQRLKNIHESHDDSGNSETESTYHAETETAEAPEDFIEIIDTLLHLDGVDIEMCGRWLWLSGNTYANREQLKNAGCKWASKKKMWYWHPDGENCKSRKKLSIEQIRNKYGSENMGKGKARLQLA